MNNQFNRPGENKGFPYGNINELPKVRSSNTNDNKRAGWKEDSDLIIEDNTIYEIDRECYERLKRLKRNR